jgi:capsular polysaccharide biosynthesis protein
VNLSLSRRASAVLVLLLTLLGAGAGFALETARGVQFQARTEVLVRFWSVESFLLTGQSSTVTSADVSDAATLAGSRDVLARAADALDDGRNAADLSSVISVTPESSSNAVTIVATAGDASTAEATSEAVAAAMIDALADRIKDSAASASGEGDYAALLEQRSQVLTGSVRPLVALATNDATQTSPAYVNVAAFGIVGLAGGVLLVIGLRFARPSIEQPRVAQRVVARPAVGFGEGGSPEAARLVRRLLDDRPRGTVLVVPVDVASEKEAQAFVDWARKRSTDVAESARVASASDPAATVLAPRPKDDEVAAVLLLAPKGTTRRALSDAATLLASWRPVDAVVVPT